MNYIWNTTIDLDSLKNKEPTFIVLLPVIHFSENGRIAKQYETGNYFLNYNFHVRACYFTCEALMQKILEHFYPQTYDFRYLAWDNLTIPEGYEEMVCRALYAGIQKDHMDFFIYCTYSFETILRHILAINGYSEINPNQQNRQDVKTFEKMLRDIEQRQLLYPQIIEEIRLIFTDKGFNLRNEVAHATFSAYNFYAHYYLSAYLWCFFVRFLIIYKNYFVEIQENHGK